VTARIALVTVSLITGAVIGSASQQRIDPSAFRGKDTQEAARALLEQAKIQAGRGSWERIAVGRAYYLGGMKPEGQAIFDEVLKTRPAASDILRIGRVYREANEWPRAKELFDRYVKENPRDEQDLAEIGAYYLLAGDRDAAEALFEQSFKIDAEVWATVAAAGAYLGVVPQQ
jgi:tetratricopeptide (TPR) repeat protein